MKTLRLGTLLAAAALAAACDSNDGPDVVAPVPAPTFSYQVLHASPDAPLVNVSFNGSQVLSDVDYKQGSGQVETVEGTYPVEVNAILPDGSTSTVIGPADIDFAGDTTYTIAAVGKVADGTLAPLVISQPRTAVSTGNARAFILHAAPDAPTVDVFVTAPGADLAASAPLGTFSFTETLGPAEVAAGDYQVRVTPAGDASTVVFDSGTIPLADGDDLVIAAVNNTATGDAPISLVALTGGGSAEIFDAATPADLRVVHASPDTGAVDVIVDDALTLVDDLVFPAATPFVSVDPATYNVKVTDGTNASVVAIEADLAFDAATIYDVLAIGPFASIEALLATDDFRRVATEAKIRLIHASPTAQDVDIYLTADNDITDDTPLLEAVPFGANTGFLPVLPGTYFVTIVPAGTQTAAIGPIEITVEAGGVYTAVARDEAGGGAVSGTLILLDDFVAP